MPKTLTLPDSAVLLLFLPPGAVAPPGPGEWAGLRQQLGPDIHLLLVDSGRHPAVVQSFGVEALPACVLVHQGVELWRHAGWPRGADLPALLLGKLPAPGPTPPPARPPAARGQPLE